MDQLALDHPDVEVDESTLVEGGSEGIQDDDEDDDDDEEAPEFDTSAKAPTLST